MKVSSERMGLFAITFGWWAAVLICAHPVTAAEPDVAADFSAWGGLLALPMYNMTAIHGKNVSIRGPLSRQVFVTGEVFSDAELFMSRVVEQQLARKPGLAWEAMNSLAGMAPLRPSTTKKAHLKSISEQGRRHGADHVLIGYLYAFRQRDGGNYGAKTPAKVVFELVVVHTETERVVRQQHYIEAQQALSDNLLNLGKFIRRKGRWLRAQEMAADAVREMLDSMLNSNPTPTPP